MSNETFEFGVGEINDMESQKPTDNKVTPSVAATQHDDASSISSEGLNTKYIIDNLSPTWGIMLTVQDNLNLRIGMQLKKNILTRGFGITFRRRLISQSHCLRPFLRAKPALDQTF